MNNERLTKKVYLWDRSLNNVNGISSWSSEVKNIFYNCGLNAIFDNNTAFPLKRIIQTIKEKFIQEQVEYLRLECEQQPKLRTFIKFKQFGPLPAYLTKPLTFFQRKHIAKIRLGSLAIRIESGRYSRPRLEIHERLCPVCIDSRTQQGLAPEIENEIHFLFFCDKYEILRANWFSNINKPENFSTLDEATKLNIVLNQHENCKPSAQFIVDAYGLRSKLLLNKSK